MKTDFERDPHQMETAATSGELSLDDLEYVIGGLSRPFVPDAEGARVYVATTGGVLDMLSVKAGG